MWPITHRLPPTTVTTCRRFRSLIPSYIRDSSVAVVVYDVCSTLASPACQSLFIMDQQHHQRSHLTHTSTDTASFDAVEDWINDVKTERGGDVLILMVGNKVDLASARVVSVEAGQEAAQRLGAMFMECSARTGQGIKDMFRDIAETLPSRNTAATPAPRTCHTRTSRQTARCTTRLQHDPPALPCICTLHSVRCQAGQQSPVR